MLVFLLSLVLLLQRNLVIFVSRQFTKSNFFAKTFSRVKCQSNSKRIPVFFKGFFAYFCVWNVWVKRKLRVRICVCDEYECIFLMCVHVCVCVCVLCVCNVCTLFSFFCFIFKIFTKSCTDFEVGLATWTLENIDKKSNWSSKYCFPISNLIFPKTDQNYIAGYWLTISYFFNLNWLKFLSVFLVFLNYNCRE